MISLFLLLTVILGFLIYTNEIDISMLYNSMKNLEGFISYQWNSIRAMITNQPHTIWVFYRTEEVNSRHWQDFGSRNTRFLNIPLLNLCYQTILYHNKDKFNIVPIMGIHDVAEILGGWEYLPSPLQKNTNKYLEEREIDWIRSAILSKQGGLWLSPFTLCLKPFSISDQIVFYGTDINESHSGNRGTLVPGFHCMWSPRTHHPFFTEWENICRKRVEKQEGGQAKWDWVSLSKKYNSYDIIPEAEGMRKKDGSRIQLDDILCTQNEIDWISSSTRYVPLFEKELHKFRNFMWILRLSEDQILRSEMVIKKLIDICYH